MVLKVFSIHDSKAEAFMAPFTATTNGMAIRMVMNLLSDPNSQASKYPGDFSLFMLGEFDDNTGRLKVTTPSSLGLLTEWTNKEQNND